MKLENKIQFFYSLVNLLLIAGVFLSGGEFCVELAGRLETPISPFRLLLLFVNVLLFATLLIAVRHLIQKIHASIPQRKEHIDDLTGFTTRHGFGQIFDHIILDSKRSKEPLTILLINFDHFRRVNEMYGNEIGDCLLIKCSKTVRNVLRASDLTCRWEGDTILVLLRNCPEHEGFKIAETINKEIKKEQVTTEKQDVVHITSSIGVAQMQSSDDVQTLLTRAETGLHCAKDSGRDAVAVGYEWILIDYACDPIF